MKYINEKKQKLIEGELRSSELAEYLKKINTKNIFLSEDASGMVSKVEYDPKTNQLVGFVLPIDSVSGMPIPFSFKASSASEIQKFMELKEKSTLVYVVIAQPLIDHAPPFVLQIFGTDNKFTANDVEKRWKYTIPELKK